MKKLLFFLSLNSSILFGQSTQEAYRFSKDILSQIEKDSVAWRFQTGATELSFSGHIHETLEVWDKNGVRKPKLSADDSSFLTHSSIIIAKDYIIEQSIQSEIVIINEAHHLPYHRTFTRSLLADLFENGYRYLGLEALFDSTINERKFATLSSGYYTKEPEFGNLIHEALTLGFTLFSYEASVGKNGKEREIEQADNIQQFISNNPNGKVLIHCGYAHAYEHEYPSWGKAMAGRLKDNMKIDPFTIEQTVFLEKSNPENNHRFIQQNNLSVPFLLLHENGSFYTGKNTDIVVIHPKTTYSDGRPYYLIKHREKYIVPNEKLPKNSSSLILAYRENEYEKEGIPTDIIEVTETKNSAALFLPKGKYTIIIKDANYNILERYNIEIE